MSLRDRVIKLAQEKPELRRHLLPLLRTAMVFDTKEQLEKYLKEHPKADKSKHKVEILEPPSRPKAKAPEPGMGAAQAFHEGLRGVEEKASRGVPLETRDVRDYLETMDDDSEDLRYISKNVTSGKPLDPEKVKRAIAELKDISSGMTGSEYKTERSVMKAITKHLKDQHLSKK